MKNLMFILALGFVTLCSAQKVKEADVPAPVKAKFASMFTGVKVEKWEKEGNNYEAEFDQGKTETSAVFDASGNHLETEIEIAVKDLPKGVSDYVAANLKGKKISEASKITAANGTISYEAEIGKTEYLFDANGGFIKKQEEVDDDDDDDDKKK